jgi:hypothetical protein
MSDDLPIIHTGDSFEESPYKEEHRPPYVIYPDYSSRILELEAKVDKLIVLMDAIYEKYMDKPIDLDA